MPKWMRREQEHRSDPLWVEEEGVEQGKRNWPSFAGDLVLE